MHDTTGKQLDNLIVLERGGAVAGLARRIGTAVARWQRWRARLAASRSLASLTDRQLQDIGIPRELIGRVAAEMAQRAPLIKSLPLRTGALPGEGIYRKAA